MCLTYYGGTTKTCHHFVSAFSSSSSRSFSSSPTVGWICRETMKKNFVSIVLKLLSDDRASFHFSCRSIWLSVFSFGLFHFHTRPPHTYIKKWRAQKIYRRFHKVICDATWHLPCVVHFSIWNGKWRCSAFGMDVNMCMYMRMCVPFTCSLPLPLIPKVKLQSIKWHILISNFFQYTKLNPTGFKVFYSWEYMWLNRFNVEWAHEIERRKKVK